MLMGRALCGLLGGRTLCGLPPRLKSRTDGLAKRLMLEPRFASVLFLAGILRGLGGEILDEVLMFTLREDLGAGGLAASRFVCGLVSRRSGELPCRVILRLVRRWLRRGGEQ